MINLIKRHIKKKEVSKLRDLLNHYDSLGYHREMLDNSKRIWTIFNKDFQIEEPVYWLGHDGFHGLLHGDIILADSHIVVGKQSSNFWKKVDELNFELYKHF